MRVRQWAVGQESGDLPHERPSVSGSAAAKAGAGEGRWRKLCSEVDCCLLPRKSTRPSCVVEAGHDCLRRYSLAFA